jgi:hypothetical protein
MLILRGEQGVNMGRRLATIVHLLIVNDGEVFLCPESR